MVKTPYFVFDRKCLIDLYQLWQQIFSNIRPYYAMKCNPHPLMLEILSSLQCGFDCASSGEFLTAIKYNNDIIFANPIKTEEDILLARNLNIKRMTFDNQAELEQIQRLYPEAELILRFKVNDEGSICRFGEKFGCTQEEALKLIENARILNMNIIGFSFHVGSGCTNPKLYYDAIELCYSIIIKTNIKVNLLDIGGGFSSVDRELLTEIGTQVKLALNKWEYIPEIIAEPGRFFAESPFTLKTSIIGRNKNNIYIDDSVYGSFNNIFFDHSIPKIEREMESDSQMMANLKEYMVYGRTCDSIDKLGILELSSSNIGDILTFPRMGAYTLAAASYFNGFTPATVIEI